MSPTPSRRKTCLIYCCLPYAGIGWPQTCVSIVAEFPQAGIEPVLVLPRLRKPPLPSGIRAVESLPFPLTRLPWKYVSARGATSLARRFRKLLLAADPAQTIAYFWPGAPLELVELARSRGIVTVREMINTFQGSARLILDAAYARQGLPPSHTIRDEAIAEELAELALYDYVFAPSPSVQASLLDAGVARNRILSTSYGWLPSRFGDIAPEREPAERGVRALFVGAIGVRKGVPELLEAWKRSGVVGELTLVGSIEASIAPLVERALGEGSVRHVPFTSRVEDYYASADLFVFPTHEEGCPQVVMEAAACGLPVITTPMGAAHLVADGANGIVIAPGDVGALADALARLAGDPERRRRLAAAIHADARAFTYPRLSRERGQTLAALLDQRSRPRLALVSGG